MSDDKPNKNGDLFVDGAKVGVVTDFKMVDDSLRSFEPIRMLRAGKKAGKTEEMQKYESYKRVPDRCFMSQESWDALLADMEALMPEGIGFALVLFEFGDPGETDMAYCSTGARPDVVKMMRELGSKIVTEYDMPDALVEYLKEKPSELQRLTTFVTKRMLGMT